MGSRQVSALDYLKDASGDPVALVKLAKAALASSDIEDGNPLIATVEGLTFARLAAAQGDLAAFGLMVTLGAQLGDLLDDMGTLTRQPICGVRRWLLLTSLVTRCRRVR